MKILSAINGSKKNKKAHRFPSKTILWLIILVAIMTVGIGAVSAWNMHEVQQANYLQSHNVSIRIDEDFPDNTVTAGDTKIKKVAFSNPSSVPVFLRIAYVETWENGSLWLEDDGNHVIKNWTSAWSSDWWDGGDGWYYYTKVLPAGGSTEDILSSVTFPVGLTSEYLSGQYSLAFMAEAVQLSDEADVNTSATEMVFKKTGTVSVVSTSNGAVTAGTVSWSGQEGR